MQGVGFRYHVLQAASRRGVDGWVRNLPDGDVEVHAEGDAEALDTFIQVVKEGPTFARVDRLDRTEVEPTGADEGFDVRY